MGIKEDAVNFINTHKKELIQKYAGDEYPASNPPLSIFMAGSPGAGKTEFSMSLLELDMFEKDVAVRIDADEIKKFIPHYDKTNSDEIQGASVLGLIRLHDYCLKKKKNFILDGTFSDYESSEENIKRSIKYGRDVDIFYVYQDPLIAWEFTKKRGELEGRFIPKDMFIDSFFSAKDNVNRIKENFGKSVTLHLIIKNITNGLAKFEINIDKVDHYLKVTYTRDDLVKLLK
jgi:predicted ABC-type ATPase